MPLLRSTPLAWRALNFFWPRETPIEDCRQDVRHPASGTMTLYWTQPEPGTATVILMNVSAEGMQIELPALLQAPQRVRLLQETREYSGVLLYCQQNAGTFVAGILLTDPGEGMEVGQEAKELIESQA
jgi:hypothetical protein